MVQMKWRFLGKIKVGLEFEVKRRQKKVFFGGKVSCRIKGLGQDLQRED